jgi:hypothetical protein
MANTFSISSVINHSSTAGFRAWAAEVISALFTSVGLTQTADTGQINTATVNLPAINVAGGYVIGRFNDTAQATSPLFFKLEFGTGSTIGNPMMWVTVGTGSNGAGTLTGTVMTRVSVLEDSAPASTSTPYVSRYVYNPTYGFHAFVFKLNGAGSTGQSLGGLILARSTSASGAVTTDAAILITNSITNTGSSSSSGQAQMLSFLQTLVLAPANPNKFCVAMPYDLLSTNYASQIQLAPVFFMTPVLGVHACMAVGIINEIPIGNTVALALVGAPVLTFLNFGMMFGGAGIGPNSGATYAMMCLWQ